MMLWTHLSWAELSATADRRTIAMGETLRLTLLGDAGEQPAEIDLTPLNRDWEILSRSSATNARFINGQNQVTRTLEMELAPCAKVRSPFHRSPQVDAAPRRWPSASTPNRWWRRETSWCSSRRAWMTAASTCSPRSSLP